MKANAPVKIYIPRLEGNETFVHEWSATKFRKYFSREIAENVEYVRTDAFIEKACEWLENNLQGIVGGSIYMEDFRKYMKGEEV
jgi:hypothetical protein